MSQSLWTRVDDYIAESLLGDDPILDGVLEANRNAGLPAIDVSPAQGKLLQILALMCGARRILEIGTLGGYSTIWLARALPADGLLISLEYEPRHAEVARENIARAGLAGKVEVRTGPALDSLPALAAEGQGPFDLIFIDADKPNNRHYLEWAVRLSRRGTALICDNVVRDGTVLDATSPDPSVQGARDVFALLGGRVDLDATAIQTVGAKGFDGFAIARMR